jgi:hypothetical protein
VSCIQGQLLRLSEWREVAIYVREGSLWIADFVDGHGELVDPTAWFRFNCGTPWARGQARRRMLLESAIPLSAELAARIEELHFRNSPLPLSAEIAARSESLHSSKEDGL